MSIKKDIFAPLALGLGATRRAAMLLLVMMLTTVTAWATDKTLSGSESYTAQDGDVLTGSTSGTVTIANNAKITLSDVTITGGIVCAGTAEITLVGMNSVTGASQKAGIQVGGSGTKLTIKGNGSLTANGGTHSAGIGLSRAWDPDDNVIGGDIIIEGGNITSNGGSQWGAGIGTGVIYGNGSAKTARIGNITIKGGTVKATGGTSADGIGTGYTYTLCTNAIGTVTIYDGIEMVDASSIKDFANVVYKHVDGETETDVTANKTDYFTIIEDGDRRIIEKKDNTDYTITIADDIEHGSIACAATTAKFGDNVTITATPALGYRFSRLVVKDAQNNDVASTDNSFFMPKSNVTVSAVFEQGVHGTTEFAWGYIESGVFVTEATIYDGVTTVNLQQGKEYFIGKDYQEDPEPGMGYYENTFRLDEDPRTFGVTIPYSGGTGLFLAGGYGKFRLNGDAGFYDITMTDVGNGKWSVSILKTVGVIDNIPDQTYTGSEITPEPLVMAGSLNLTKGTDYVYSYENNENVGTAKVIATFQGDYASLGSVEKEFTISLTLDPADISVNAAGTEYTIHTARGWNVFCELLAENTKGYFDGKTVRLGDDITVTRMAGGDNHDFTGTFDGGGHTLTFSHTATDNYCAPFRNVQGATAETPAVISNLNVVSTVTADDYRHPAGLIALQSGHVSVTDCNVEAHINCTKGTANPSDLYPAALVSQSNGVLTVSGCTTSGQIATDGKYAAGLVGIVQGTATISDCLVSVTIDSSTSGDGTHGGIVASLSGVTNIYGTVFNGRLLGEDTESVGGFIGWRHKGANIYNSLFIPTEVTVKKANSATFARNTVDTYNCYYTTLLNDGTNHVPALADGTVSPAKWHNGKATRTVAADADVTIDAIALTGTATQYTVSGITAYANGGIKRTVASADTYYYGQGDNVSLTLSHEDRDDYIFNGYTSNDVTITNGTFTMPDANVTITATWTKKVQTGLISGTVTIPDGASITLSDATITGGIVCNGTAEITLVGENVVGVTTLTNALIYQTPGIQIGGSGTTLTIKGNGSLNATGGSAAAGIGLGRTWDANATGGSVVIEGGTITASGGNGIGTGTVGNSMTAHMDGIIIKGGTVNARLGKGTINFGSSVTIGTLKIYDGIEKVDASAITESVTYMHVDGNTETDVTASASTYFTIIEDGDRRIIEKKDNTDYTITIADGIEHGTIACAATTAKYGDKITITATPDFGYRLSRLVVKDAQNKSVASMGNSFTMPQSNVTVSAVFEQGVHGTTEFAWGYFSPSSGYVTEATIYDGVTTVELQQGKKYFIGKDYQEGPEPGKGFYENEFRPDEDPYAGGRDIPYSGGTGSFMWGGYGEFTLNGDAGYYDITMTDVGNGKWNVSILKTAGQMDVVPDQTYTGSEIKPEPLVMAGSLNLTKGTDYVYSYENNENVGTAKVIATFQGDYASLGTKEATFTIKAKETNCGAITLVEDQNGVTAIFDGTSDESITITDDIEVNSVTYNRTFTMGRPSTVMLPFSKDVNEISGGTFYTFGGVEKENNKWEATMNEVMGSLTANTPYLFVPTGTSLTFTGGATLNTTGGGNCLASDTGGWEFHGTYTNKVWDEVVTHDYGFAALSGTSADDKSVEAGQFVRLTTGASAKPMRCYLSYVGVPNQARALTRGAAATDEELPQSIIVRLIGSNGETTAIGTIDTKTGEMTFDSEAWYTLDGVRLSGKPTKKGLYINNGKKVVIK